MLSTHVPDFKAFLFGESALFVAGGMRRGDGAGEYRIHIFIRRRGSGTRRRASALGTYGYSRRAVHHSITRHLFVWGVHQVMLRECRPRETHGGFGMKNARKC